MPRKGERSPALACINKIEPCMAYANWDTGSSWMAARQPKLCLSTLVLLAYCQLVVMFTFLICQFTINMGWALSAWLDDSCLSQSASEETGNKSLHCVPYQSAGLPLALWGWFNCEGGWRRGSGPGVTGSTLFSHPGFLGPWRWGSACQIKSHSQVSLPAVMYIHRSSRSLPLLEIHKKVNC